jgi:hypothetical protein
LELPPVDCGVRRKLVQRTCALCGIEKPLTEYSGGGAASTKRDCYCRPCRAEYGRRHHVANRARYVEKATRRKERLRETNYELLISYLRERICGDCGERDVLVLEFDHVADKSFSIATALRDRSWPQILAEIEKCEVVCANCHRRRTAIRGGFARYVAAQRNGALFEAPDPDSPD